MSLKTSICVRSDSSVTITICGGNISPWLSEDILIKALLSAGETAL